MGTRILGMYFSYQFKDISEFERAALKQRFVDQLKDLNEIQAILEEALCSLQFSKKVYIQRIRAKQLVLSIESKIKQVEFDPHLKMLSLSLDEMKKIHKALKKRRIKKIDSRQILEKIAFLEEKMNDEICREACGLEKDLLGFPVSGAEVDLLLQTVSV